MIVLTCIISNGVILRELLGRKKAKQNDLATVEEAYELFSNLIQLKSYLKSLRVCFISGEYKPGICGISDYIKLLTQKFEHLGHEVEKYHINHASTLPKVFEDYQQLMFTVFNLLHIFFSLRFGQGAVT